MTVRQKGNENQLDDVVTTQNLGAHALTQALEHAGYLRQVDAGVVCVLLKGQGFGHADLRLRSTTI